MATYTARNPDLTGIAPSLTAVASSDKFANPEGHLILHVHNGNGSSCNVTISDQSTVAPEGASAFDADVVVAVAAGTDKYIGPFEPRRFNDDTGFVVVGYSVTSSVTAEVLDAN